MHNYVQCTLHNDADKLKLTRFQHGETLRLRQVQRVRRRPSAPRQAAQGQAEVDGAVSLRSLLAALANDDRVARAAAGRLAAHEPGRQVPGGVTAVRPRVPLIVRDRPFQLLHLPRLHPRPRALARPSREDAAVDSPERRPTTSLARRVRGHCATPILFFPVLFASSSPAAVLDANEIHASPARRQQERSQGPHRRSPGQARRRRLGGQTHKKPVRTPEMSPRHCCRINCRRAVRKNGAWDTAQ